jgi:hypothetical protein
MFNIMPELAQVVNEKMEMKPVFAASSDASELYDDTLSELNRDFSSLEHKLLAEIEVLDAEMGREHMSATTAWSDHIIADGKPHFYRNNSNALCMYQVTPYPFGPLKDEVLTALFMSIDTDNGIYTTYEYSSISRRIKTEIHRAEARSKK